MKVNTKALFKEVVFRKALELQDFFFLGGGIEKASSVSGLMYYTTPPLNAAFKKI